ncbi:MAG TPA: hypothetical protein VF491_17470 [Vicinamibacterales bacterium]
MPTVPIKWADNTKELIANLRQGLNQIDATRASAEKMVRSLSGENLLRAAGTYAAAVDQIGGAAKLTAQNQARVNEVMQKAVAQLEASGRGASDLANHYRDLAKQTEAVKATKIESWFGDVAKNITTMAAGFISAQAVIGGVKAGFQTLVGFMKESVQSAQDAQAAQTKLNQALRQQGTFSDDLVSQYGEMSTAIQNTTVFSDDLATQMQALLVQVGGVMPSAMDSALKASTDLAAGLGIDLQSATMLVAKAADGHTETLGKYGITVSEAELKSKGFEAVLEAINRQFGGQAAAQVDTYAGRVEQLANAWDNLKEAVGRVIIQDPIILAAIENLTKASDESGQATDAAAKTLSDYASQIAETAGNAAAATPGMGAFADSFWNLSAAIEAAAQAAAFQNAVSAAGRGAEAPKLKGGGQTFSGLTTSAQDQTAQRVMAAGMAEGARLADEEAKKRKALADAIAEHTKRIQEQAAVLSGQKAASDLKDLLEAWNKLTPAQKANEETVKRILDAYEPLRAQVGQSGLSGDLEKLREETERADGVLRSRAIPGFLQVSMNLEQMRNLAQGFTAQGLIPMNAQFTDAGRAAAALATHLDRLKLTRDTLAAAVANQTVGLPAVTTGITGADRSLPNPITTGFESALEDLPGIIAQGFANGGKIADALRAASARLGAQIGKDLGSAIGGQLGSKIGEAVGSLAGPLVGKIGDALTTSPGEDVMHRVGREWGIQITEAMGDQIAEDAKNMFGGSRQAAELFHLHDIIQLDPNNLGITPRNVDAVTRSLRDVFSMIQTGQMTIAQGAKVMDENWQDLIAAGTDGFGFISDDLKEIIRLNAQYGTQSKEIAAFVKQQGNAAIEASNGILATLDQQLPTWDKLKATVDETMKAMLDLGKAPGADKTKAFQDAADKAAKAWREQNAAATAARGELEDLGVIALATFSAAVAAGASFAEALDAAQAGLSKLSQAFNDLGISSDNAALNALLLQSQMLQNNPALVKGVSSLGQAFAALSNLGLLNVDTFGAMQRTGMQMYSRLQAEAAAVGGTTKDALLPMQDYLHQAQKAAEELGVPLDANTQMLIDQSKELGIWKDAGKSATDKLLDGMQSLVDKVQELINKLLGIPSEVNTDINVNTHHNDDGGSSGVGKNNDGSDDLDGDPATPFSGGGIVGDKVLPFRRPVFKPIGADVVPAMLRTTEMVLNTEQQRIVGTLMAAGGGTGSAWNATQGDVYVTNEWHIHGDADLVNTVQQKVIPIIHQTYEDSGAARTRGRQALEIR